MTILVATLLCDRKAYSQMWAVPNNALLTYPDKRLYVNIESEQPERTFGDLISYLVQSEPPALVDIWHWRSNWHKAPAFDQDQAGRLAPITIGRNMARDCARATGASHVLYVDADVIVPHNSIELLLEVDRPIVGGLVPGRGCHSQVYYIFGEEQTDKPYLAKCRHGTAGFVLIQTEVLEAVPWFTCTTRDGYHLSEDPAFAMLAQMLGFGPWYIRKDLVAQHLDNPERPLTEDQVSQF